MPANLRQLTSLRIFAAARVVAYHYWPSLTGARPAIVDKGYLGMELFFVLSGFILSHVYLDEAGAGRLDYQRFLWARLARIYPVQLATLASMALMGLLAAALRVATTHPVIVWSALPQNLLLVQAWNTTAVAAWNHPSWSISAEWFAYLLFPLFASAAWACRQRSRLALVGTVGVVLTTYPAFETLAGFPLTHATLAWGLIRILPCFALGCAVNLVWRQLPLKGDGRAVVLSGVASTVIVGMVIAHAPDSALVVLFGALIYVLACIAASGSPLLASPMLVYLGEVSFCVYMVCFPWQLAFSKAVSLILRVSNPLPLGLWLGHLAGVLPVAMLAHHFVERPARDSMRRAKPFTGRPRRTSTAIAASSPCRLVWLKASGLIVRQTVDCRASGPALARGRVWPWTFDRQTLSE